MLEPDRAVSWLTTSTGSAAWGSMVVPEYDRGFYRSAIREPIASSKRAFAREVLAGLPRSAVELREMTRLLVHLRRVGWQQSLRSKSPTGAPMPWMNLGAHRSARGRVRSRNTCAGVRVWELDPVDGGERVPRGQHRARSRLRCVRALRALSVAGGHDLSRRARCGGALRDCSTRARRRRPSTSCSWTAIDRVECVRQGIQLMHRRGTLVLDDSHRPDYDEAFDLLAEGFESVTVWGPKARSRWGVRRRRRSSEGARPRAGERFSEARSYAAPSTRRWRRLRGFRC